MHGRVRAHKTLSVVPRECVGSDCVTVEEGALQSSIHPARFPRRPASQGAYPGNAPCTACRQRTTWAGVQATRGLEKAVLSRHTV